jgi:hypothetical protein
MRLKECLVALPFACALSGAVHAQDAPAPEERVVVTGERYRASGFHRWLLGAEYRDLWTTPVALEVLDLHTYAGGLVPVRPIGHGQTQALALKGADGQSYTFRPLLKDPAGLLPVELRETFARTIITDQMASGHPAGHVIAPGLLGPAGILHNTPRIFILPDDPALGAFRERFANVPGDLEVWTGTPGFGGTTETLDGEGMWKALRASPEVRADSRAYLKARLVDQLMGDWDRHREQWRWGKVPGKERWQPIPEDRDQAFVRFEGLIIWFLRPQLPLLVDFGPKYSSLKGLTFDGWDVDKRILADLDKDVWNEVAAELRSELTDEVIEAAVRRMPPEYYAKDGARLTAGLRSRRDTLPAQADRFYDYINRSVDVFCTDASEHVAAVRFPDGDLEITARAVRPDGTEEAPYFHRRFEKATTHEVRVYLYGGVDEVRVTGGRHDGVLLRVIAGSDADVVDDSLGGGTRVSAPAAHVTEGPGTHWDRRPYTPPPPNRSGSWIPPRDWGRQTGPLFLLSYGSDYGVVVGGALNTKGYGFRKDPWADQQSFRLVYATKQNNFRGTYAGEFRFENSPLRLAIFGLGSGIEALNFFGVGDDSAAPGSESDYRIEQDRLHLETGLIYAAGPNTDVFLGVAAKVNKTEPLDNPILNEGTFYGEGTFSQVGLSSRLRLDRTGGLALPRRGLFASAGAAFYPALADVTEAFGELHAQARTWLGTPGDRGVTLALKAGGQRVFGTVPFFEQAFIGGKSAFNPLEVGGGSSVRGLPAQRYAGRGSLYGSADVYLSLVRIGVPLPLTAGLTGFADTGRVFVEGEDSHRWHQGYGGGIFFTTPGRRNMLSVTSAWSEGYTAFYVRAGLAF